MPRRAAFQQLALGQEPAEPQLVGAPEGERFVARVEPIAARQPTRLIVAYAQELRGRSEPVIGSRWPGWRRCASWRAPALARAAGDGRRPAARGGPRRRASPPLHRRDVRPATWWCSRTGPRELGLRHDNMVVARISPVPHDHPDPLESLAILFDTSASQALGWDTHVDRLGQVVGIGSRGPRRTSRCGSSPSTRAPRLASTVRSASSAGGAGGCAPAAAARASNLLRRAAVRGRARRRDRPAHAADDRRPGHRRRPRTRPWSPRPSGCARPGWRGST